MEPQRKRVTMIDASNLILGRMATLVAKSLLQGESVVILNAEKATISGKRLALVKKQRRNWKLAIHERALTFLEDLIGL